MDQSDFDALTRVMAGGVGARRAMLRLLAGSALTGLVARLGLSEEAEAKGKRHGKRNGDRKRSRQLHAAGKKRQNQRNKNHHKPKKPKDPKPQLCDTLCADEGGHCCPDGSCAEAGHCCPGEKTCAEGCVADDFCCDGERHCDDGSCRSTDQCCPEERRCSTGNCIHEKYCCGDERMCASGACISEDLCCPEEHQPSCGDCEALACQNGRWACRSQCQVEDSICCNGECLLPCSGGKQINPATCQCECPQGSDILADGTCCPHQRACGLSHDAEGWHHSFCCAEDKLCSANSICCPAEWAGLSVCHTDACPCFLCSDPPPGCIPST